jgi:hypothetical protein
MLAITQLGLDRLLVDPGSGCVYHRVRANDTALVVYKAIARLESLCQWLGYPACVGYCVPQHLWHHDFTYGWLADVHATQS